MSCSARHSVLLEYPALVFFLLMQDECKSLAALRIKADRDVLHFFVYAKNRSTNTHNPVMISIGRRKGG